MTLQLQIKFLESDMGARMISRVTRVFTTTVDKTAILSGYVAAALTILMCLLVFCGVIARYLLHSPLAWRDEISAYLYVVGSILALAYATYLESHVASEMLLTRFPQRVQIGIGALGYILVTACIGLVCYYGTLTTLIYFSREWRSSSIYEFILWPIMAVIPLGFLLFGLQCLSRLYALVERSRSRREGDEGQRREPSLEMEDSGRRGGE